jgi:succinate dehydrogenase / fumarate reductase flavoprotein subunit
VFFENMLESIRKVKATRKKRFGTIFPELTLDAKSKLLEAYHPDFNLKAHKLRVGVNKDDLACRELVVMMEAYSKLTGRASPF